VHYPRAWPARVTVTTASSVHEKVALRVPGDPEVPFDENQVATKFRRLTGPLLGERPSEELLRVCFQGEPQALVEAAERAVAGVTPVA
jgi:2-methylcitrate dehydratase PrpD